MDNTARAEDDAGNFKNALPHVLIISDSEKYLYRDIKTEQSVLKYKIEVNKKKNVGLQSTYLFSYKT